MDWNKDKSIKLSLICVYVFAALLLVLDVMAPFWASWVSREYVYVRHSGVYMLFAVYTGSAAAWICLWYLRKLLLNIQKGNVFVQENVQSMRRISWCCGAAAVISFLSSMCYLPVIVITVSAAFMMLIVRIVKNAFQQAIDMKSELDLTI